MNFRPAKTSNAIETRPLKLTPRMLALEPRYVFDAALASELSDAVHASVDIADTGGESAEASAQNLMAAAASLADLGDGRDAGFGAAAQDRSADIQVGVLLDALVAAHNLAPANNEVAFIDARLADVASIISAIPDGTRIVLIDTNSDGVNQMTSALENMQGVTGIHLIGHGEAGSLQLGTSTLDANSMSTVYRQALTSIHDKLSADADILIYGCNFGAGTAGDQAAALLAELTGADVASSDDLTGAEALGGDWDLEKHTGSIEVGFIEAMEWNGVLDLFRISATTQPVVRDNTGAIVTAASSSIGGTTATRHLTDITKMVGATVLWEDAGFVGTQGIDLRATVISVVDTNPNSGQTPGLHFTISNTDDPSVRIDNAEVRIRWDAYKANTYDPVTGTGDYAIGDVGFFIRDIDAQGHIYNAAGAMTYYNLTGIKPQESVRADLDELSNYQTEALASTHLTVGLNIDPDTGATITDPLHSSYGKITATNLTDTENATAVSGVKFNWNGISSWEVTYRVAPPPGPINLDAVPTNGTVDATLAGLTHGQRFFDHDGDGDLTFASAYTVQMRNLDLDGNNSTAPGNDYQKTFTENGAAVAVVDTDIDITGLDTHIESAKVALTNAKPGDELLVAGSSAPSGTVNGLSYTISNVAGVITVQLTGSTTDPTVYENALKQITFNNTSENPDTTNRRIEVTFNNGTVDSNTAISTISVTASNDAPQIDLNGPAAGTSNTATYTEDQPAVPFASALATIVDPDSSNLQSMTVVLTNAKIGDTLVATTFNPAITYNTDTSVPGQITLTMSGSASVADYEALLRSVRFSNPGQNFDATPRNFSVTAYDGVATSAPATATVNLVPVNDAPVIGSSRPVYVDTNTNHQFDDGETNATFVNGSLSGDAVYVRNIDIPAGTDLNTVRVAVTLPYNDNAFRLSVNGVSLTSPSVIQLDAGDASTAPQANLVFASDGADVSTPWVANVNGLPRVQVIITNNGIEFWGTRNANSTSLELMNVINGRITVPQFNIGQNSIQVTSVDGAGPDSMSGIITASLPASGNEITYNENASPLAFFPSTNTVWDVDNATLQSATITLTDPVSGDYLSAGTLPAGITASAYDPVTGTITLTGTASPDAYKQAIMAIGFASTSDNPTSADRHIEVVVSDGALDSNKAVTTVHVVPANDAPVAVDDTLSTDEDTTLSTNIITANGIDSDPDSDPISITAATIDIDGDGDQDTLTLGTATDIIVGGNTIGKLTLSSTGALMFVPEPNFHGATPPITYTLSDNNSQTDTAVVLITVNDVNDPPVATASTSSGDEDATSIPVDLTGTDIDGTVDFVTVTTLPPVGQGVLYMPNGTTPVAANTPISAADAANLVFVPVSNFNGTVTIPFTVTDDDGATSSPANEVITVNDVNDPPVATASTSSGDEDTDIPVSLTGTDVDGTITSVTVTTLPPTSQGILYMPDGTTPVVAGTPISAANAANLVFKPATNFNGTVTIPFTVTDDDGATSAPANEVITVNDVNDPPVATASTSSGNEDTPIAVGLAGTDVDGTIATVTVTTLPPTSQGILYMPDGTTPVVAGTPMDPADAANLVFVPASNFNGTVTIPFTVTDDDGTTSAPANEVITVNDVNDPPVATASTSSGNEDTPIAVGLTGTDIDGTIATVTVSTLPPTSQGILYMPDGTTPVVAGTPISAANAANLVFKPATNFNGTVTIPFTVTDDDGATSAPANEVITVNDVNDPPVATASTSSGNEDTPIAVGLAGTDVDGTVQSVTVTTLPPTSQGILYMPDGTTPVVAGTPMDPADAANLVFKPATNFNGTVTIPFTVTDDDGTTSAPANEVITVNDVNDPPLATASTSSGDEDTDIPVSLTGTDVDGTITSVTVSTLPPTSQGILYMPDGTTPVVAGTPMDPADAANLVFVPASNFNGTVTIPFTVTDDDGTTSAPANEVITVNDVNDPPVATASTSSGDEDTDIPVSLAGTDVDGTIASVTVTTLPPTSQGILYMPDGTTPVVAGTPMDPADAANLVFVPASNFNGGPVTISFTVTDDDGTTSAPADEVITVNDVNDPPVATPSTSSGAEDTPIAINLSGTDVDGTIASVTVTTLPPTSQGILYMPDGTTPVVAGTPMDPADAANLVFVPASNFNGTVTIPFTVTDDDGTTSSPANEVITVNDVNDPPVATASTSSGDEDTDIPVSLTGTDVDGTITSVTVTTLPPTSQGILYMPDGTTPVVAGTPMDPADAANLVFVPASNFNGGPVTISFTVTDDDGTTSAPADEVITVNDVNDPPVATPSTSSGAEDTPIAINLSGTDVDGTIESVTVTTLPPTSQGILYMPDGTTPVVAGTPIDPADAANLVFVPASNFNGTVTIPFTVTDDDGTTSAPANEVIAVGDVNDPPVATPSTSSGNEDTPITINLSGTDLDGTIASVTVTTLPPTSQGVLYMPDGTTPVVAGTPLTPAEAATLVFKPATNFNGTVTIAFTVTDDDGTTSAPANEVITVNAVNDAPVDGNETMTTPEDTPLVVSATNGLLANTTDVDGGTPAVTGFTIAGITGTKPVGVPVTIPSKGTLTINADGSYRFVPAANYHGPVPVVTYTVSDGYGGTNTSTLSLTVTPVNDGPDAVHQTTTTGFQKPVTVPLLANDIDIDGDTLTVVSASVPASQGTVQNVGGVWTFTPAATFSGTAMITYTIRDPSGATDTGTHAVVVANAPPVLGTKPPLPGTPFVDPANKNNLIVPARDSTRLAVDLDSYFIDANGDPLTFVPDMSKAPTWLKYDPVTHTVSGTPPADNTGTVKLSVRVSDGHGGTIQATLTFVITNPPPDAVDGTSTTAYMKPVTLPLLANDTDPDGDPLTVVSATVPASQGTLTKVGGDWVFTPREGFVGSATITYTVRDQDGATDTAKHVVTVTRPTISARDDLVTTKLNTPVAANAADGDVFVKNSRFTIETKPLNGTVTMKPDGSYVFVPKPGFAGKVTFTYRVTDPTGAFAIATETINISSQAHNCLVTFGPKT